MINHILATEEHKIYYRASGDNVQTHLGHETEELQQIPSRSALIVMGRKNTFKHTCQPVSPLVSCLFDIARSEWLVTAVGSIILDVALFYVFPTVLWPLTYREA